MFKETTMSYAVLHFWLRARLEEDVLAEFLSLSYYSWFSVCVNRWSTVWWSILLLQVLKFATMAGNDIIVNGLSLLGACRHKDTRTHTLTLLEWVTFGHAGHWCSVGSWWMKVEQGNSLLCVCIYIYIICNRERERECVFVCLIPWHSENASTNEWPPSRALSSPSNWSGDWTTAWNRSSSSHS